MALKLHNHPSTNEAQMAACMKMLRKPIVNEARYQRVWTEHVSALGGIYLGA